MNLNIVTYEYEGVDLHPNDLKVRADIPMSEIDRIRYMLGPFLLPGFAQLASLDCSAISRSKDGDTFSTHLKPDGSWSSKDDLDCLSRFLDHAPILESHILDSYIPGSCLPYLARRNKDVQKDDDEDKMGVESLNLDESLARGVDHV